MSQILGIVSCLVVLISFILCFKFYKKNKNGKIEIRFSEIEKIKNFSMITHTGLILEICYSLTPNSGRSKEQSALLIYDIVRERCNLRGFKLREKTEKPFQDIEKIIEDIKPLCPSKTGSELTSINYKVIENKISN